MDPVALLATTVQAGLGLLVMFVVPGIALGPILVPGASTPLARAGRAVGVSLLTTSVECTMLAALGLLSTASVLLLVGASCAIGAIHAARTGRRPRRPTRRKLRWLAGAAAGIAVAAALVLVPSRVAVGDALMPYTSTVWYYANLARAVAVTGGFPTALPEWGTMRPFQADYLAVTAHTAAALQLLPGGLPLQIEMYRLALLAAGIVLATLLLRRWVSSWLAMLGALLLFATARLEFKFLAYKPETFAFAVALFGLWLLDRALVERSWRHAVLAAVAGIVVYLAHAEVFLVLLAFGVAVTVSRALATQGRFRVAPARGVLATVVLGATVLLGAFIGGNVANGVLSGSFRILGYVASQGAAGTAPLASYDPALLPAGWTFTGDPTWDFNVASVAPAADGAPPPTRFLDARLLPRSILVAWPGLDGRSGAMPLVLAVLVLVPLAAWPWLDRRRRRAVVAFGMLALLLLAGSYLLFTVSRTYVPMRTGPRRILPYELLVPVGAGLCVLWLVDRAAARGWRALFPARGAMVAAGSSLVILAATMVWPGPAPALEDPDPGITAAGYEAYAWIDANLPVDARILANAYTDGAMTALARRSGILDGRAVYLEDPAFLHESTALCLGARVLFANPDGPGASTFAIQQHVGYLLVVGSGGSGSDVGGYAPFTTDLAALAGSGRYTLVRTFGGGRLLLYRVGTSG